MSAIVASVVAFAMCFAGMAALASAMPRHYRQAIGRDGPERIERVVWRGFGVACLLAAIAPCVAGWGPRAAIVAWPGWLSVSALLVVGLLAWRPRWLAAACGAAVAVAALTWWRYSA